MALAHSASRRPTGPRSLHMMLVALNAPTAIYGGGGMTYDALLKGFLAAGWSVSAAYLESLEDSEASRRYDDAWAELKKQGVVALRQLCLPRSHRKRGILAKLKSRLMFEPNRYRPWQSVGAQAQAVVDEQKPDVCFLYSVEAMAAFYDVRGATKIGGIGVLPHKLEDTRLRTQVALHPWSSLPQRIGVMFRRRHVLRNLRDLLGSMDGVVAFSANEGTDCARLAPAVDVAYFRNMVSDEGYIVPKLEEQKSPPYQIILVGHLRGTATQSGLYFLAKKVLPALQQLGMLDHFHFVVIGKFDPPAWLTPLLGGAHVTFTGFVDDFAHAIASADAMLVPIPDDVGNRTRIVSAWSAGCCIVTHASSISGMPEIEHGVNALVGHDGTEIATLLMRACSDRSLNLALRQHGRASYEKYFHPNTAFPPIDAFIRSHRIGQLPKTRAISAAL